MNGYVFCEFLRLKLVGHAVLEKQGSAQIDVFQQLFGVAIVEIAIDAILGLEGFIILGITSGLTEHGHYMVIEGYTCQNRVEFGSI